MWEVKMGCEKNSDMCSQNGDHGGLHPILQMFPVAIKVLMVTQAEAASLCMARVYLLSQGASSDGSAYAQPCGELQS